MQLVACIIFCILVVLVSLLIFVILFANRVQLDRLEKEPWGPDQFPTEFAIPFAGSEYWIVPNKT